MVQNSLFAILARGASLHKCRESLASPVLQRRQEQERQPQQHAQEAPRLRKQRNKRGPTDAVAASIPDSIRQQYSISVKGLAEAPPPLVTFADELNPEAEKTDGDVAGSALQDQLAAQGAPRRLPGWLVKRLEGLGYKQPTPIQMQVFCRLVCPQECSFLSCWKALASL